MKEQRMRSGLYHLLAVNHRLGIIVERQEQSILKQREELAQWSSMYWNLRQTAVLINQDLVLRMVMRRQRGKSLGMTITTPSSLIYLAKRTNYSYTAEFGVRPVVTRSIINRVDVNGSAHRCGLRAGDALLTVNGQDLSNATHEETVNSLHAAQEPITVEVLRRPSTGSRKDLQNTSSTTQSTQLTMNTVATQTDSTHNSDTCCNRMFVVPAPPSIYSSLEDVTSSTNELELAAEELGYDVEYDEVILRRESCHDRIGLTLCYGETEVDGISDVFIGEVEANSVAGRCGRIEEGDQIIKINNKEVRGREEAIKFFSENRADISLLICRPANLDQIDDGFLEDCGGSCLDADSNNSLLYTQDMKMMPLIEEERSEFEDDSLLTDTATLPSHKEKEAKDSGLGQDSAGSSEQECDSSHYDTLNISDDTVLIQEIVENSSNFRQLLESRCADLAKYSQVQQHCDNNNRVVPRMGTKLMPSAAKPDSNQGHDTAYNTSESLPTTLELTKNLAGSTLSISDNKKTSRRSHEKRKTRRSSAASQSSSPSHSSNQSTASNITYTTEDKLAETMVHQQKLLLEQARSSTLTRDSNTSPSHETSGNVTDTSNMEWVVKRRPDGTRYFTRRPIRTKILSDRKKKLENERCGMTTDDDAMSELKTGRHWSKDERRRHVQKSREHQERKAVMQKRIEMSKLASREGHSNIIELSHKKQRKNAMKDFDFVTVQELLCHEGKISVSPSNLISVTTV